MQILLIGNGGREHALCWKLSQGPGVQRIFTSPGNPGTAAVPKNKNIHIPTDDLQALVAFASTEGIDLTVVGPEQPLAAGIVDRFRERGLKIFGPTQAAARLESSKIFAKEIMKAAGVPTARSGAIAKFPDAEKYLKDCAYPIVLKADGLAAGKGVLVAGGPEEAIEFARTMMLTPSLGGAPHRLLVEEFLEGEEVSFFVLSDGNSHVPLGAAQGHKRLGDGDRGPNTGGMGAYSPAPVFTPEIQADVEARIVRPVLDTMREKNIPFTGVLFLGLMLTSEGPKVLEFNVRFGDPETQAILPRLDSDLAELFSLAVRGRLAGASVKWMKEAAVTVVLASVGYPGNPRSGQKILGTGKASDQALVFHAGTRMDAEDLVVSGGRALSVTSLGATLKEARDRAYHAAEWIEYEGKIFRKDIGWRAL
jgi:phosphoribosylamine--glycine ligase